LENKETPGKVNGLGSQELHVFQGNRTGKGLIGRTLFEKKKEELEFAGKMEKGPGPFGLQKGPGLEN